MQNKQCAERRQQKNNRHHHVAFLRLVLQFNVVVKFKEITASIRIVQHFSYILKLILLGHFDGELAFL